MPHDAVCRYHYRGISKAWLTTVTVWLKSRDTVAECPCRCGSWDGIYNFILRNHISYMEHFSMDITGIVDHKIIPLFSYLGRCQYNTHTMLSQICKKQDAESILTDLCVLFRCFAFSFLCGF